MGIELRHIRAATEALAPLTDERWVATIDELDARLPSDELIEGTDLTTAREHGARHCRRRRAVDRKAQAGSQRLLRLRRLENLLGCEIHTADRIVPEWREVVVGAEEEVLRMSWPVCRTTDNLPCRSGDLDPSLIVLGALCVASWPPVSHSRCSKRAG